MVGTGGLLRWDGTSRPLTALPVSASPTHDHVRLGRLPDLVSGDQAGPFQVTNASAEPITVTLQWRSGFGVGLLVRADLGRCAGVPDGGHHGACGADLSDLHDGRLHLWAAPSDGSDPNGTSRTDESADIDCGGAIW